MSGSGKCPVTVGCGGCTARSRGCVTQRTDRVFERRRHDRAQCRRYNHHGTRRRAYKSAFVSSENDPGGLGRRRARRHGLSPGRRGSVTPGRALTTRVMTPQPTISQFRRQTRNRFDEPYWCHSRRQNCLDRRECSLVIITVLTPC